MASKLMRPLKDFFAHHRKFTPFQKVLICSIFVGVILCVLRSWSFLVLSCTYTVTLYASVTITKYVISCRTYFPSDAILLFIENIEDFFRNLINGFKTKQGATINDDSGSRGETYDAKKHRREHGDGQLCEAKDVHISIKSRSNNNGSNVMPTDQELSTEINNIITLIQHDFIESWYELFSKEKAVLSESEIIFHHIVNSLQGRLYRTDTKKLFQFILLMFKDHVYFVREAEGTFKVQSKLRRRRSSVKTPLTGGIQPSSSKLKVVCKTVEECYGSKVELHPAVTNSEIEHAYQKSIVELLLVHLLREDMHDTAALVCALKEILTFNVLQKVMDLISETTFLHERIIKITSDEEICAGIESIPTVTVSESEVITNNVQSILTQRKTLTCKDDFKSSSDASYKSLQNDSLKPEQTAEGKCPLECHEVRWKQDTEIHTVSMGLCNECNRLCSVDKDRISPRPHTCSLGNTPTFFDKNVDPDRQSLQSFTSISSNSSRDSATFSIGEQNDNTFNELTMLNGKSFVSNEIQEVVNKSPSKVTGKDEVTVPKEELHDGKLSESPAHVENKSTINIFPSLKLPFSNPLPSLPNFRKPSFKSLSPTTDIVSTSSAKVDQNKSDIKRSLSQGDVIPTTNGNTWPLNAPSVFQKVKILSTETAKEVGSFGEYTLYNIEYEALYQSDVGELVDRTGIVKRRFREFVNLQLRLEDNSAYKKSLKDVKGPKKLLPSLPFGKMGKDTVVSRKELLESFLLALIGKEDICNGEEIKQFLGYSGDGHIAFVRKPVENTGPRIDQRLVKTMSGVFDKIVEGLPSLPQQLPRIISPFDQREEKTDLTEKQLTDDTDDIDLIFEHDIDKVSTERIELAFEKFVEHQSTCALDDALLDTTLGTSVLTWQDQENQGTKSSHKTSTYHMTEDKSHMTPTTQSQHTNALNHLNDADTPLSDAVLGILTEALHKQDHWVCRENVIKASKVMFGKGLNKFLKGKVEFLTSTEMTVFYLKTLRETVWPNGELSTEAAVAYTDLQKEQLRQQATRCLANFLPGALKVILGSEDFDNALEELMDALKYEKLNRHFWYTVFDVVLEELFPEVNTQELQRKLSATVQSE